MERDAKYMRELYEEYYENRDKIIKEQEDKLLDKILDNIEVRCANGFTWASIPNEVGGHRDRIKTRLVGLGFQINSEDGMDLIVW